MRVVCPSCNAAYNVPDASLAGGQRRLRCARCLGEWIPEAPVAAVAPPVQAPDLPPASRQASAMPPASTAEPPAAAPREPDPAPPPSRAEARLTPSARDRPLAAAEAARAGGRGLAILAWLVSLVAIGLFAAAVVIWREDVVRVWPPSERLFMALGLH